MPTKQPSVNLDVHGKYLKSCRRNCKRSPAICTFLPPTLQWSTSSVTRSSVPGVEKWTQVSSQLPPCEDCLSMHILRSNYQAAIWRKCLEPSSFVPSSTDCGWTTDEGGNLVVEWMRGSSCKYVTHVNYQCAPASAMASSALECADCKPAAIRLLKKSHK